MATPAALQPLPKLPGRLTAELILRSPQGMNSIKEYEINLRGACAAPARNTRGGARAYSAPARATVRAAQPAPTPARRHAEAAGGRARAQPYLAHGPAAPPAAAGNKIPTVENLAVTEARCRPAGAAVRAPAPPPPAPSCCRETVAGPQRARSATHPTTRAQNQFDCIDLSDNEIVKLEGFPPLHRLQTLLVHNNRIARLGTNLGGARSPAPPRSPAAAAASARSAWGGRSLPRP